MLRGGQYTGAWDYGVFDDDTAYDALDDLKESANIIIEIQKYFDKVIESEYVDYEDGHYALVSAAVIDSVMNGTSYRCDDDYMEWIKTLNELNFTPLKQKAIDSIDCVLSEHSELKELWEENEGLFTAWREDKLKIQKRLIDEKNWRRKL